MSNTKQKKKTVYKRLNIPFHKELYEALRVSAERENRSLTSQIIEILETHSGTKKGSEGKQS